MYRVLIADDELPALRFVRSIIEQFSQDFKVIGAASSGDLALDILQKQTVDLLITDVNMHGMNGIDLSRAARKLQPNIHIVIISGFGEFEYAQGAIQAGVDEYLLKPVNIAKMASVLGDIRQKLDTENADLSANILPALACAQPYDHGAAEQLFGGKSYRFAYIRWGNLDMTLPKALRATSLIRDGSKYFQVLRGRDEEERVLIVEEPSTDEFLSHLSVYMTQPGNMATWTAVYTPVIRTMDELPAFINAAINKIYQQTIIGKHQLLHATGTANADTIRLPASDLKQLSYFITSGKTRLIKDYFLSLAANWERSQLPQRQVWHIGRQVIHQVAAVYPPVYDRLEDYLLGFTELIRSAGSYYELMTSAYSLLFGDSSAKDRKMSARELYDYTIGYIGENYAQPLSMQSVCDEIGISQTYLSRLFRKYSDTTFNAYLTKCRMEAAMHLLREKPDLLLRDVAACVGYEDSSYFTKVFRQYTNKTPSQWAHGE